MIRVSYTKKYLLCDLINMKLVIEGFNKSIHKKSNRLVIKEKDEEIENIKIQDISDILIIGKGSISFDALNLIANNNVKLVSMDYYGNFNYILESPNQNNIELKRKQYLLSVSFNGLEIARELIKSKISNQRYTLKTLNKNKKLESVKISEIKINDCINELDDLSLNENFFKKTRMQIMGIEGKASIEYWNGVRNILPPEFDFDNRQRNADDLVNSMLNYGYAILESEVTKNILLSGLDPYCGFLHFDMPNRTSLTYDLMEEFRQQLVDKVVFTLINHKQVSLKDLDKRNNSLKLDVRKLLSSKILDKIYSTMKYNDQQIMYYQIIRMQVDNLKDAILYDKKYDGFYLRW